MNENSKVNNFKLFLATFVLFISGSLNPLLAQITLPAIFADSMVLQRNFDAPVWGWAEPGTELIVSGSWSRMPAKTAITDKDGKWMVKLKTIDAGGPYELYINDRIIKNVMLGEVWICSGQSNMQMALDRSENPETEIMKANYPDIRFFYVARDNADQPIKNCYGSWVSCNPENAKSFSAVAYYFGKEIYEDLNVPIGLIHVSWGGSTAQAWVNYNVLQSTPEGQYYIEKYKEKTSTAAPGIIPRDNHSPSGLYNAMLHPLIPFGIRGAIWYQGEANVIEHSMYKNLMNTLISNWRDEWGQGNFPFYFVQLAPFNYKQEIIGAALRDAQRKTLEIANTGMAVTMDIGNPDDIHPIKKKEVGQRLALWALANTYGKEDLVYSGPLYKSMQIDGKKIILTFDHVGSGLDCKDEELTCFTIAGDDKIFYPAKAEIENNTIIVFSKNVKDPIAVRFAFNNGDEPNFFNKEGLPASTFRTDDWEIFTETASIKSIFDEKEAGFLISMSADNENEIRFTLDGTEVSKNSPLYTEPFTVFENVNIKAKVFIEGEPSLLTSETKIIKHLASGKKLIYTDKYDERYNGGGDLALVNSVFGSTNFRDGNWQGFHGKDLEVIIDLGEPVKVSSVRTNCLQVVSSWIVFPKQVSIFTSDDGTTFNEVASIENEIPAGINKKMIHEFNAQFETTKTKYIKVIAKNFGPLPEWHVSAGEDAWLFVDEIIVE